jgi:hypothetical protein
MMKQAILIGLMFLAGCTSARVVNSWRDPTFAGPIEFKKTLVLVIRPDSSVRRSAEDELVRQIGPNRSVAAYQVLTEEERTHAEKLKAKLQSIGADGVVTMAVVGARTETTWVPGSGGPQQFYSYYDHAAVQAADPGYLRTDRIVSVETKIYSVADDKLIWSGLSDTFDPSEVKKAVADIAKAVGGELRKQKLIT